MKYLGEVLSFGLIISFGSCTDGLFEDNTPAAQAIEVNASTQPFIEEKTRANEDDVYEDIKEKGFTIWSYKKAQNEGGTAELFYTDTHWYDTEKEVWLNEEQHFWPDQTSPLDFYALSPTTESSKLHMEGSSMIIDFNENQLYGDHDIVLAKCKDISYDTNKGSVSLEFKHIVTKVTVKMAFANRPDDTYDYHYGSLSLYGDICSSYNITDNKWVVSESLPVDFDVKYPTVSSFLNMGSSDHELLPSDDETNLDFQEVDIAYVMPQKYHVSCSLRSLKDGYPVSLANGYFDLDLTGKAGYNFIVKITISTFSGDGSGILKIETTNEEISAID